MCPIGYRVCKKTVAASLKENVPWKMRATSIP